MAQASRRGRNQQPKEVPGKVSYRDRKAHVGHIPKEGFGEIVSLPSKKFIPKNDRQRRAVSIMMASTCTFLIGPAGTGKTFCTLAQAVTFLHAASCNMLICTNPGVEIGVKLGILPGDKDDKIAVSVRPMRDILNKLMGASQVERMVASGKILFEPLGSILGTTFDDAIVVLDEAQNATPAQIKALLTRIGQRSKIVICGDAREQKFITGLSGLDDAMNRLGHLPGVGIVEFTADDIVRSDFCKDVILAYRE